MELSQVKFARKYEVKIPILIDFNLSTIQRGIYCNKFKERSSATQSHINNGSYSSSEHFAVNQSRHEGSFKCLAVMNRTEFLLS